MKKTALDHRKRIVIATNSFDNLPAEGEAKPGKVGGYVHYSQDTVNKVRTLLEEMGHAVDAVPFSEASFRDFVADAKLRGFPVAGAIDLFEPGAGGCKIDDLPRVMDELGMPFSGSGLDSRILQRDKDLSKKAAEEVGVLTPVWARISNLSQMEKPEFLDALLPAIIKPNSASVSSLLFRAETREQAIEQITEVKTVSGDDVLVESFVPGAEITVVKIGNGADADVIPMILVWERSSLPPEDFIFFQNDKLGKSPVGKRCNWRLAKTFLDQQLCDELQRLTNLLSDRFLARDIIRVDFRIHPDGDIHFIETNAQPNINAHRGSTAFTINREFYRTENALEKHFLQAALSRMAMEAETSLAS